MYDVIMAFEADEVARAAAMGTCVAPTVFMNQADGYQRWAAFAAAHGQPAAWLAWSEDEGCAQRDVAVDTIAPEGAPETAFCALGGGGGTCTDAQEPNEARPAAKAVGIGTIAGLQICAGDSDWFAVSGARTVKITFSHAAGDLDLVAYDASGTQLAISDTTHDSEQVSLPAGGTVKIYGYSGATNGYTLIVQ